MRIWDGKVEGGKILLEDREAFRALIKRFEGLPIQLTLDRFRSPRTSQQNRYYWGVVVAILAQECGYESEEMHEALKARFLRRRQEEEVGGLPRIGSTASLDTAAFAEYCDQCIRLAAEMNIVIPPPDEGTW
jgi:hypothetical protein